MFIENILLFSLKLMLNIKKKILFLLSTPNNLFTCHMFRRHYLTHYFQMCCSTSTDNVIDECVTFVHRYFTFIGSLGLINFKYVFRPNLRGGTESAIINIFEFFCSRISDSLMIWRDLKRMICIPLNWKDGNWWRKRFSLWAKKFLWFSFDFKVGRTMPYLSFDALLANGFKMTITIRFETQMILKM